MASKVKPDKAAKPIFYVYEHWRPDKNECFWVGKGHANRAYDMRRNNHHRHVVEKLTRLGLSVEIRIIEHGLTEATALDLEVHWIAYWRKDGAALTNMTSGGEGVCGLIHSAATRAILSAKTSKNRTGAQHSGATREKLTEHLRALGKKRRGVPNPSHGERLRGRKHSDEHKAKISAANMGRVPSPDTIKKIVDANTGQKRSIETRERLRVAHLGNKPSEETRKKMTEAQRNRWALRKAGAWKCQP